MERLLFVLQRLTALILGPFVLIHLVLILYTVRGGLSAGDILERTQGNMWWITFYSVFVVAVAIHGPIGVRRVMMQWLKTSPAVTNTFCAILGLAMLGLGLRAVVAVGGMS